MESIEDPDLVVVIRRMIVLEAEVTRLKRREGLRAWFFWAVQILFLVFVVAVSLQLWETRDWQKQVSSDLTRIQQVLHETLVQPSGK
jgi:hypothetical protein